MTTIRWLHKRKTLLLENALSSIYVPYRSVPYSQTVQEIFRLCVYVCIYRKREGERRRRMRRRGGKVGKKEEKEEGKGREKGKIVKC